MTLLDEALSLPALLRATARAARGKRQRPEVARFLMDAEHCCLDLQARLLDRDPAAWTPSPGVQHMIRDPKLRLITVVPFADRVVHHAICAVAVPLLEQSAITDSWACREGRGQHGAVRRAQLFARRSPWALKGDVSSYFASIPHEPLLCAVARRLRDGPLVALVRRIVEAPGGGRGLPIGALTSQHLANFWLGGLDHVVKDEWGVRGYLRYMDDFILFGERPELHRRREDIVAVLAGLGLRLNPNTRVMPTRAGVPFLGWRVGPGVVRPRRATWRRWARRLRIAEEPRAIRGLEAATAHFSHFPTFRLRRASIRRAEEGASLPNAPVRLQPGQPGRLLEQRAREHARGQPKQEHARQPEEQPRGAPFERNTQPIMGMSDAARPWLRRLYAGVDPAGVLRGGSPAESTPAGGGPSPRGGLVAGRTPSPR